MDVTRKAISFVPKLLLSWVSRGVMERKLHAVVAFADVSGFTKMSAQLATIGKEGAEALTGILNEYFTQMIGRIEEGGGFVGKFGGDAMTIFFPVFDNVTLEDASKSAVQTCLDLQGKMSGFQDVRTKAGSFTLGMKIGVASGEVLYRTVGPEQEGAREFLLAGSPLDQAAEAEHHGSAGDVILSGDVHKSSGIEAEEVDDGFYRLGANPGAKPPGAILKVLDPDPEWSTVARTFIDPAIFKRIELGLDSVGEIRRVSVIFMSYFGLDYEVDDKVGDKLEEVYSWVYELTTKYGGSINKVDMGDKGSIMILTFGAPIAHENNEELAVRCGLELTAGLESVKAYGIEQRLGLASGVVFSGEVGAPTRQEYTVMGTVVNLSARLMAHSKSGQLLVEATTYQVVKDQFNFAEPEYVKFKGLDEPQPVYEVTGLKSVEASQETKRKPFIGRERELRLVQDQIREAMQGRQRTVVVRGNAGIGKSRFIHEVLNDLRGNGFAIAAGEALSYAFKSPYLIWVSILRRFMGLPAAGGGEAVLKQLDGIVAEIDPEHPFRTPVIANILGIDCHDNDVTRHFDAQLRKENLFDFLVQLFHHHTAKQPVCLLIEDGQWIDRQSLELVAYLIRSLADYPLLILDARRHYHKDFKSPHISEIEANERTCVVSLEEFNPEATDKFIQQTLDADAVEEGLQRFVFDSSHGNPAFVEQLLANMRSLGRLVFVTREDTGETVAGVEGDLAEIEVPDSLSSLIMSQLDRLGTEAKLTVKVAAVIGRQFKREILSHSYPVTLDEAGIQKSIDELATGEILFPEEDNDLYDYIFKNLLTRDVAYDSLLFSHRREYHHRIGLTIEAFNSDSLKEYYEELARHFNQSEDDDRAINYLHKAGDKAYDIYANDIAEDYYSKGLRRATVEEFPRQRYKLLTMRSAVYSILGMLKEQKVDLDELLNISELLGDRKEKVTTLDNLAWYFYRLNQLDAMKSMIDQAKEIYTEVDFPYGRINVDRKEGLWYYVQNKYDQALESWEKCRIEAEKVRDWKGLTAVLTNCGLVNSDLGNFDEALKFYNQSVEISHKMGNKKSEAVNLGNIGLIHQKRGEIEKAMTSYEQALEIAGMIGSKQIQIYFLGNLAWLYQKNGQRETAIGKLNEQLQLSKQSGYQRSIIQCMLNLGSCHLEAGEFRLASEKYTEVYEIIRSQDIREQETTLLVNLGLVHHYLNELPKASESLAKAIELAAAAGNKPIEDYARRYLGFVQIDQGRLDEASEEFQKAQEIAAAIGSKASIASAKIGLGWIGMLKGDDRTLLEEGISEAEEAKDAESIIKGRIALARALMQRQSDPKEPRALLKAALELCEASGHRSDVGVINELKARLSGAAT